MVSGGVVSGWVQGGRPGRQNIDAPSGRPMGSRFGQCRVVDRVGRTLMPRAVGPWDHASGNAGWSTGSAAGHQRHSPRKRWCPTSSLRSASSSAQVISATLPASGGAPPHRYALHRRRRRSSAPLSPARLAQPRAMHRSGRGRSPSLGPAQRPARTTTRNASFRPWKKSLTRPCPAPGSHNHAQLSGLSRTAPRINSRPSGSVLPQAGTIGS